MDNAQSKANSQDRSKPNSVMAFVIALPSLLGGLLFVTGLSAIFLAQKSSRSLNELDRLALGPTLAFQEITLNLKTATQNILKSNLSGASRQSQAEALDEAARTVKKLNRLVKAQTDEAKGKPYEFYFQKWLRQWGVFRDHLSHDLEDKSHLSHNLSQLNQEAEELVKEMGNINDYIQVDVKDRLDKSTQFSKHSSVALALLLLFGGIIGSLFSLLIIKNIRKLFVLIEKSKQDIETLLNNLGQGFMVFDREGIIQAGSSKAAEKFFGKDPTGLNLCDILQVPEGAARASIQDWYKTTFQELLDFDEMKPLGPSSFEKLEGRYIELDYRAIHGVQKKLEKIICIATDKTREKKLQEQMEVDRATAQMIITILKDRPTFVGFIAETRKIVRDLNQEMARPLNENSLDFLFRGIHTIKGGCASFHILSLMKFAHSFESELANIKSEGGQRLKSFLPSLKRGVGDIEKQFEAFLKENSHIIGEVTEDDSRLKVVPVEKIYHMSQLLHHQMGRESQTYREFVKEFVLEPFSEAFKKFENVVVGIAERQEKQVKFEIVKTDIQVCIDPYRALVGSFIHVFRNAVDHGIEFPFEREDMGKDQNGHIRVRFERKNDDWGERIRVVVEDDGRGIDPAVIKMKAVEKGIFNRDEANRLSDNEALQIVFKNGFSTKEGVTEISGRGVGLDAVKYEASRLGGTAWIESVKGKGTKIVVETQIFETPVFRPVERVVGE